MITYVDQFNTFGENFDFDFDTFKNDTFEIDNFERIIGDRLVPLCYVLYYAYSGIAGTHLLFH